MRRSFWWFGALAASLIAACADKNVKYDEAQLGRLSMDQKQEAVTADHNYEVARGNRMNAEVALSRAKGFRDLTDQEVKAARERVNVVNKAVALGRKIPNPEAACAAGADQRAAEKQLDSAQAKRQMAGKVVELRDEQVKLASRQVDLTRHERALARIDTLRCHGIPTRQNVGYELREREKAQADVNAIQGKVANLEQQACEARTAWEDKRKAWEVAQRELPVPPAMNAPLAAPQNPTEPLPRIEAGQIAPQPVPPPPAPCPAPTTGQTM
jgi:hypothetical protein